VRPEQTLATAEPEHPQNVRLELEHLVAAISVHVPDLEGEHLGSTEGERTGQETEVALDRAALVAAHLRVDADLGVEMTEGPSIRLEGIRQS